MAFTEAYKAIKAKIVSSVEQLGWTPAQAFDLEATIICAGKDFSTAVGVKSARLYLSPETETTFALTAEYYSEGRNILSTTTIGGISPSTESDVLGMAITAFCEDIDTLINGSYARRLKMTA